MKRSVVVLTMALMRHRVLVCCILLVAVAMLPAVAMAAKTAPSVTIASVTPSQAPKGATIVVTGKGLGTSGGSVKFLRDLGTTASPKIVAWSASSITCVVPSMTARVHGVEVVTSAGRTSNVVAFAIGAASSPPAPSPSASPTPTATAKPIPTITASYVPATDPSASPTPTVTPTPTATPTVVPAGATVFDVTDYGAVGNGTTDDSLAIQRAYDAAYARSAGGASSTVLFPTGTYYVAKPWMLKPIRTNDYWNSSTDAPVASPTYLCRGVVTFRGYGATIRYTSAATRFCWLQTPNPMPEKTTYGNLVVEGFFIEHSNRIPSAGCGSVLWLTGQGNVDNVTVKDCSTDANLPGDNVNLAVGGVQITGGHATTELGYFRNINIDDNVIHTNGQNIVVFDSNGDHSHVIDDVHVDGNTLDELNCTGSSIMLGGGARGWRCSATNNDCSNVNDDGIEIDAFNKITVTGNTFHRIRQFICLTRFSLPYKDTVPVITMADNTYSGACGPYQSHTGTAGGLRSPCIEMRSNMPGGVYPMSPNWGDVVVDGLVSSYTGSYSIQCPLVTLAGPMNSVAISNVNLTDPRGGTAVSIHPQPGGVSPLPVTIQGFTYNGKPLTMADVTAPGCKVTLLP